jgi:hypothetical protein
MVAKQWLVSCVVLVACGGGGGKNNDSTEPDAPDLPKPACNDGIDNDGDGKMDFPNDPGCFAPQADDEKDDCPSGPNCPQCANGMDDDRNGMTDYPNDPGCDSASDNVELTASPVACGSGLMIKQLPNGGQDTGTLGMTSTSNIVTPCGGGTGLYANAYVINLVDPKVIVATTDMPGTSADTMIDIRSAMCSQTGSEVACNDNVSMTNTKSTVTKSLTPGIYYIIVQSATVGAGGAYQLSVSQFQPQGAACTQQSECFTGTYCRVPSGQTAKICAPPVCSDGIDDDGDNKVDYPNDPGCATPDSATETDTCPGAGCPACGDGADNDSDGQADYPNDFGCSAASATSEVFCATDPDVINTLIAIPTTNGNNTGKVKNLTFSCQSNTGPDVTYPLRLPVPVASLVVDTEGSVGMTDSVVALRDTACATSLGCDDDSGTGNLSLMTVANVPAGVYAISVANWGSSSAGAFKLNVKGTVAPQTSCTSPLFAAGVLVCPTGTTCSGTPAKCQ